MYMDSPGSRGGGLTTCIWTHQALVEEDSLHVYELTRLSWRRTHYMYMNSPGLSWRRTHYMYMNSPGSRGGGLTTSPGSRGGGLTTCIWTHQALVEEDSLHVYGLTRLSWRRTHYMYMDSPGSRGGGTHYMYMDSPGSRGGGLTTCIWTHQALVEDSLHVYGLTRLSWRRTHYITRLSWRRTHYMYMDSPGSRGGGLTTCIWTHQALVEEDSLHVYGLTRLSWRRTHYMYMDSPGSRGGGLTTCIWTHQALVEEDSLHVYDSPGSRGGLTTCIWTHQALVEEDSLHVYGLTRLSWRRTHYMYMDSPGSRAGLRGGGQCCGPG